MARWPLSKNPVLRFAPWTVIWSEDKRRARLAVMQAVLSLLDYPGKAATPPDPAICSDPAPLIARVRREALGDHDRLRGSKLITRRRWSRSST